MYCLVDEEDEGEKKAGEAGEAGEAGGEIINAPCPIPNLYL